MASYQLSIPLQSMSRRRRARVAGPLSWILVLILGTISFVSCAPSAMVKDDMGVRSGFRPAELDRVAVMPFFVTETFGLTDEEQSKVTAFYEQVASHELEQLGVKVIPTTKVAETIEADASTMRHNLALNAPLETLFEELPLERQIPPERRAYLKESAEKLGVETVLLGQVVYHTSAECQPSAQSPYTDHVAVVGGLEPAGTDAVPCAIAHFQAKLVDARTGRTLWHNRALRELRAPRAGAQQPDLLDNARAAVSIVFKDEKSGLHQVVAHR